MRAVLVLTCLALVVEATQGCSCFSMSRKKKFCEADYVVEVRVLSKLINRNKEQDFDDYYKVELLDQIKMNGTSVDMTKIYTGTNGGLCGVYLRKKKEYILGGSVETGRMNIDLCRSIVMAVHPARKRPQFIRNTDCN